MTGRPDPFETLAVPDLGGVDPAFASGLRARLRHALTPAVRPPQRGDANDRSLHMTQLITPYLCVHDARAALDWYRDFFGAAVSSVIEWEGRIGHAELDVEGAVFYLSDEAPQLGVLSPRTKGAGVTQSNVMVVADVDRFVERAVGGGAVLERPMQEAHGTRNGWIMDPFGHRWNVGTPLAGDEQALV